MSMKERDLAARRAQEDRTVSLAMWARTARIVAAPLTPADLTRRIDRLRSQLQYANGEWAARIKGDIEALERMLEQK